MSEELADAGGAVTAGLIAREIDRAHADAPAVGHDADEPCANCGAVRHGPYCHACGQAGHVHRTAGALVHDIAHGVFHFEGRIWHTLPLLALKPGELTRRYVDGERAKFVSPMALFLFCVFLMFAVVSNLAAGGKPVIRSAPHAAAAIAQERIAVEARIRVLAASRITAKNADHREAIDAQIADAREEAAALAKVAAVTAARHTGGARAGTSLPVDLHSDWPWLNATFRHAAENPDLVAYKLKSYGYKYSWALIPLSLPFLWLLFAFRRDVGIYDHAIFAIYSLSFMSLGVVALTLLGRIGVWGGALWAAALLVPPLHMYCQLKGAYRLTRFGAGWRTAALLMIVTVTSLLFALLIFYLGTE